MSALTDAIAVTGATTGQAISQLSVTVNGLTAAQRTALVNFIATLPQWTQPTGNISELHVYRLPGQPTVINAVIRGFWVHASGNAAAAARSQVEDILGQVP